MKIYDALKSKKIVITSLLLILTLTCCFFAFQFFKDKFPGTFASTKSVPINPDKLKIVPVLTDSIGVDLNSEFKIISEEKYPEELIKASLVVTPNQSFNIRKVSGKEYRVKFQNALKPNSIYRFDVKSGDSSQKRSWAFQTKKTFSIVRTLPRHKATSVPIDTGIEVNFSHENYKDIDNYFEISPKVEGRFERHKKTAVFVPKGGLEKETVYTVKIKKGASLEESEETLKEDYIFQFQTENAIDPNISSYDKYISFSENLYNILPDENPMLKIDASSSYKDSEMSVEVYKYKSENHFLNDIKKYDTVPYWAYLDTSKINFSTDNLDKVTSFNTKPAVANNKEEWSYSQKLLIFPSPLSEGHYLVKCISGDKIIQAHVQVSSISTYIMVLKDRALVWVNHTRSGEPLEGAVVALEGLNDIKTNNEGVAIINQKVPAPVNNEYYYFKISSKGSSAFFARLLSDTHTYYYYESEYEDINDTYWKYFYLDKGLYLPTDTVNFWGVIKPRTAMEQPGKAILELYQYNYYYEYSDDKLIIDSREIDLSPAGTFSGQLVLPNLSSGSYHMDIKIGDKVIDTQYIQVQEYIKPSYKVELTPDKTAVFSWEKINFDIQASFFEGSPVSGIDLDYNYSTGYRDTQSGKITCDRNGSSRLEASPTRPGNSWEPVNLNLHVSNTQAEEEDISAWESVSVFPGDIMIKADGKRQGTKGVVSVETNRIDLSRIRNSPHHYFDESEYKGDSINIRLKAKIYEKYWDRSETGEYYDFINKKVEKTFDYYQVENLIKEVELTTSGGKYQFDFPYDKDPDKWKYYYVVLEGLDSRQNLVTETCNIYPEDYYYYTYPEYYGAKGYMLTKENEKPRYKPGENVSFKILYNKEDLLESTQDKSLFLVLKDGLLDYVITNDTKYSFDFKEEHTPNIYVKGVYFDGSKIFDAGMENVYYDYEQKELKITVDTGKQSYGPGDTVNLDIDVKDINGNPCSAHLNLSVVDEAFFAIRNQSVDTLGSLYSPSISSGMVTDYFSYEPPDKMDYGMGAEGGEGGDQIRSTFKDNAFFGTVESDSSGKAKLSFKLPDNLTSWRITYQGVTSDIKAGSGKLNITTRLPFFTDVIFNNIFLEGDSPYVTIRTFGTAVDAGDEIKYTVILENENGIKKTFTATGKATRFTNTGIGKLEEGNYSITVKAQCGSYKDAIKRDFRVVKGLLEAAQIKYHKLADGIKIAGGKSLTTLSFYNADASLFYETLNSLAYEWGERIDQKLARSRSAKLMKLYYGEESWWNEEFDGKDYQTPDGGISLLTYDSSNPELSAKICSLAKDSFDTCALEGYFYNILNNKDSVPEDVAASYWGLGSLGEPVLIEVKNLLASSGLGPKEKLYLGLALADLGDYDGAKDVYLRIMQDHSIQVSPYAYLNHGKDKDDILELTSLCSILALKLNAEEKTSLFNYVKDNSTKDILTNLEELMFVSYSLPNSLMTGKFSYELDGQKKDITLDKAQRFKLVLTFDKLSRIRFYNVQGEITVASSFMGPVKDILDNKNKLVSLTREYSVDDKRKNRFSQSDLIKVTLVPKFEKAAPEGCYDITDVLPSGLRYVNATDRDSDSWRSYDVSGQKVSFSIYYPGNNGNYSMPKKITYYARAVSEGSFNADTAMIKHSDSDAAGFTNKAVITIKR